MDARGTAQILIVADKTAATAQLADALRDRAATGPCSFHLLVPNPDHNGWRPSSLQHPDLTHGEQVLALALPVLRQASAAEVTGAVSIRSDPFDAVEDILTLRSFDEIIVSTLPHHVSMWLHVDLPRRLAHLGMPVTTVTATALAPA
jgi:hypothetical protein